MLPVGQARHRKYWYRAEQFASCRGQPGPAKAKRPSNLGHQFGVIVIAGNPVAGCGQALAGGDKPTVGIFAAILGYVPGRQHHVHLGCLFKHHINDSVQTGVRIQPQQVSTRIGKQVTVRQLHHADEIRP